MFWQKGETLPPLNPPLFDVSEHMCILEEQNLTLLLGFDKPETFLIIKKMIFWPQCLQIDDSVF
jgi:hypothetical protein